MKNNIEEIRFDERPIRLIRSVTGGIAQICLNDVCTHLKRIIYLKDGTASRRCPSAVSLDPQRPDVLFASFDEAVDFIEWMIRGSKILAPTAYKLLRALKSGIPAAKQAPEDSNTSQRTHEQEDVQVLHYSGNQFTMKMLDGRYMVNATEMARAFERRPREWLNLAETARFRQELVDNGQFSSLDDQIITSRGPYGATWIEIQLWVNFAQWLSPAFAAWVSNQTATLMREGTVSLSGHEGNMASGGDVYTEITEFPSVRNLPAPTTFQEALVVIDVQKDALVKQRDFFRANKHKYDYYDDRVTNQDWFNTTMIALDLGITAIQLNQFLAEQGIQARIDGEWRIERQYRHLRCTHFYEWYNHKTRYLNKYKIKAWSPEGREYIVQLWKRNNR